MANDIQPLNNEPLDIRIEAALCQLAFDPSIPAQSRVAALRELRAIEAERKDRDRAGAISETTDPGSLQLADIERELSTYG
jgi:hypothetical protein